MTDIEMQEASLGECIAIPWLEVPDLVEVFLMSSIIRVRLLDIKANELDRLPVSRNPHTQWHGRGLIHCK